MSKMQLQYSFEASNQHGLSILLLLCEPDSFDICWLDMRKVEVAACLLTGIATRHIRSCLQDTQPMKLTIPGNGGKPAE